MTGGKRSVPEIEPGEVSIAVLAGSGNYWRIARKRVLAGVYAQATAKLWTGGRSCGLRISSGGES